MARSNKKKVVPATAGLLDGRFDLTTMDGIELVRVGALRLFLLGEVTGVEHNVIKGALAEARKDLEMRRRWITPVPVGVPSTPEREIASEAKPMKGYKSAGPFDVHVGGKTL